MDQKTSTQPAEGPTQQEVLEALAGAWKARPHLRLCQLIGNATLQNDPYYVSNGTLLAALREIIKEHTP